MLRRAFCISTLALTLGHVPPAEFEEMYYEEQDGSATEARLN